VPTTGATVPATGATAVPTTGATVPATGATVPATRTRKRLAVLIENKKTKCLLWHFVFCLKGE
ncbi:hypothetical protein, partial [Lysinibacillus sphaericus]|uniref:hypothetical protein n=1 Tax=Lysinibacillus sphaericus TaxID=1421 RepID=UPI001A7EA949